MGIFGAVVVGVTTGWVVGYFLVRAAFKRYAASALVERQIQWHEKALRTIMETRALTERIVPALKHDNPGLWQSLKMDLHRTQVQLQNTANESVIYADRGVYLQLMDSVSRCRTLTERLVQTVHTAGPSQAGDSFAPLLKELDQALLNLANPLREKLELDPLCPEDLLTKPSKSAVAADRSTKTPRETPN